MEAAAKQRGDYDVGNFLHLHRRWYDPGLRHLRAHFKYTLFVAYNAVLQVLTAIGLLCTFFMFTEIAQMRNDQDELHELFPLGAATIFIMTYAQSLLYSTCDAVKIVALPAIFFPSLAAAAQLVTSMCMNDGYTFLCEAPLHHRGHVMAYGMPAVIASGTPIEACSVHQKTVAAFAPGLTYTALFVIVAVRSLAINDYMMPSLDEPKFLTLQSFRFGGRLCFGFRSALSSCRFTR